MRRIFVFISLFVVSIFSFTVELVAIDEKPIVVLVPSYNNSKYYQRNLDSIYRQNYQNYRVIYMDDASPDGTGVLVENYLKKNGLEDKTILIRNEKNTGALANLYSEIHSCEDHEIVITLDGDDWFSTYNVFEIINEAYQGDDVHYKIILRHISN